MGRCDCGRQQLQPDTRQSTLQTCQASFSPRARCRAPEPQPHVGAMPATPSRAPHPQLSGESPELPGDRVHSGCMTSGIRLGPVGRGHSETKFLCISSAPEAPTFSDSLKPCFVQVSPQTQPGCREGFQGRARAAVSHGEQGWPQLTLDSEKASLWVRN